MYCLVHSVFAGFWFSKFCTSQAPSNLPAAEIAGQRGEPASAQQAARIAHRIFAAHARPVGKRRAGDDDRAEQFRPQGRQDHDRPAGLAVADHAGLAVGFRMQLDDFLDEQASARAMSSIVCPGIGSGRKPMK